MSDDDLFDEPDARRDSRNVSGITLADIPALSFLVRLERALDSRALALLGTALILLVTNPVEFVRRFILEGLFVIVIGGIFRAVEALLQSMAAEFRFIGFILWDATVGALLRGIGAFTEGVLIPATDATQAFTREVLLSLGIAAPFAAAISIAVTTVLFVAAFIAVYRLVETYVPLDALLVPIQIPVRFVLEIANRVRETLANLLGRVR